jgi:outer membrane receptor protein involved in Fe transport
MQTITVTATREAEELKDIPESATVLTPADIERRAAETPNQMLIEEPGIFSPHTAVQGSPIVRGENGNKVVYLWDGIRINNGALFSGPNGYFNEFPINAVDHMEVIRGPAAVQYGSDAIGGVINVIGHDAATPPAPAPTFGGEFMTRYGTVDGEKTTDANFWMTAGRFSIIMGAGGQLVDNYSAPGVGVQQNTGWDNAGGSVNMSYRIAKGHSLHVSWLHDRRFDIETYAQSRLNADGIPRVYTPFEQRGVLKFSYQLDQLGKWSSGLAAYAYYQYFDTQRNTTVQSDPLLNVTKSYTSQGISGGGVQNSHLVRTHRIIYGVDYRREDLASNKRLYATSETTGIVTTSIPSGNVPAGNYDVTDAFLLAEFHPVHRLTFSAGTRLDSALLQSFPVATDAVSPFTVADLTMHKRWTSLTWNSGGVYNFKGGFGFAVNIAAGFRAPDFSDALSTSVPVFASGTATVPSPNVKPEHSVTYEAGPRYVSRRLQFSLSAYSTQLNDLLGSVPDGTIIIPGVGLVNALVNQNISTAYIRGIEGAFHWQVARPWMLFGNLTYTHGEDTHANVPLRFIPPTFGTGGARFAKPGSRWFAEASGMMVDRLRNGAPQNQTDVGFSADPARGSPSASNPPLRKNYNIPGYVVPNLRVGVNLWKGNDRELQIFGNVNNLFNVRYREAYSQQELLAPGVGLVLGTRVRF